MYTNRFCKKKYFIKLLFFVREVGEVGEVGVILFSFNYNDYIFQIRFAIRYLPKFKNVLLVLL